MRSKTGESVILDGSSMLQLKSDVPGLPAFQGLVHPSNFDLFPNLKGIAEHYRMYKFKKLQIKAIPQASSYSNGMYSITINPEQETGLTLSPQAWAALINMGTTAVKTIFAPVVYKTGMEILSRLKRYILATDDTENSITGVLTIAQSPVDSSSVQSQTIIPPLPLFKMEYQIQLYDLKPSDSVHPTTQSAIVRSSGGLSSSINTVYYPFSVSDTSITGQTLILSNFIKSVTAPAGNVQGYSLLSFDVADQDHADIILRFICPVNSASNQIASYSLIANGKDLKPTEVVKLGASTQFRYKSVLLNKGNNVFKGFAIVGDNVIVKAIQSDLTIIVHDEGQNWVSSYYKRVAYAKELKTQTTMTSCRQEIKVPQPQRIKVSQFDTLIAGQMQKLRIEQQAQHSQVLELKDEQPKRMTTKGDFITPAMVDSVIKIFKIKLNKRVLLKVQNSVQAMLSSISPDFVPWIQPAFDFCWVVPIVSSGNWTVQYCSKTHLMLISSPLKAFVLLANPLLPSADVVAMYESLEIQNYVFTNYGIMSFSPERAHITQDGQITHYLDWATFSGALEVFEMVGADIIPETITYIYDIALSDQWTEVTSQEEFSMTHCYLLPILENYHIFKHINQKDTFAIYQEGQYVQVFECRQFATYKQSKFLWNWYGVDLSTYSLVATSPNTFHVVPNTYNIHCYVNILDQFAMIGGFARQNFVKKPKQSNKNVKKQPTDIPSQKSKPKTSAQLILQSTLQGENTQDQKPPP